MGGSDDDGVPIPDGSNGVGRCKTMKSDLSRRNWSVREEEILMATLKELTANGWKADNGYRAGYLTHIKEAIKREFPNTDICPHPHIYSKITTWKRNYGSLMNMLKLSGIGFNSDGDYKIECDDEQWAQIVKKDSIARYMKNKSWPLIEDWKEVFGKDRAEGGRGIDTGEAVEKICGNKDESSDYTATSHPLTFEELFPDEVFPPGVLPEMMDDSQSVTEGASVVAGVGSGSGAGAVSGSGAGAVSGSGAVGGSRSGAGAISGSGAAGGSGSGDGAGAGLGAAKKMTKKAVKKRKIEDKMDTPLALMSQIHTDTNDRLKEISTRIGYDFDISTKRTEVFDQLKRIPGITLKQQILHFEETSQGARAFGSLSWIV